MRKQCVKCTVKAKAAKEAGKELHFQDEQYGLGIRIHNEGAGCTVCGKSKHQDNGWADTAHKAMGATFIEPAFRHNYPPAPRLS